MVSDEEIKFWPVGVDLTDEKIKHVPMLSGCERGVGSRKKGPKKKRRRKHPKTSGSKRDSAKAKVKQVARSV